MPTDLSVADVLARYLSLGIPHFQRGEVWARENKALLLESLFHGTPCGILLFWRPADAAAQGVAFGESASYLIVDGQQRIRCLWEVFGHGATPIDRGSADDDVTANERVPHVWCLNPARLPELESVFGNPGRHALFAYVPDPRRQKPIGIKALLPLDSLRGGDTAALRECMFVAGKDEALRAVLAAGLPDKVAAMLTRPTFFSRVVVERDGHDGLADVVGLYNRINSAGRRVEGEEKAFATLVSVSSQTNAWLAELYTAVGGAEPTSGLHGRDEVLRREKERAFGFKLFIRTFVQVAAYDLDVSVGSSAFSFDAVRSSPFRRLATAPHQVERLFDRTTDVVCAVRAVLRDLYIDDLRALPETTSLLPVFQLFIRFPPVAERYMSGDASFAGMRQTIQGLTLRLLLADLRNQNQVLSMVKRVNASNSAAEAIAAVGEGMSRERLERRLKDANSLQDRYTLLLYALLRRRGATDFSYENLESEQKLRSKAGSELPLSEECKAERQHIVPYSVLEEAYGIHQRGRISRHVANNIGNITWLSREFNHFHTGIGSNMVDMDLGSPAAWDAHCLVEPHIDKAVRAGDNDKAAYTVLREMVVAGEHAGDSSRKGFIRRYERFCKVRRSAIVKAFVEWVNELSGGLPSSERIEPAPRSVTTDEDLIRRLAYPDVLEDSLVDLVCRSPLRAVRLKSEDGLRYRLRSRADKKGLRLRLTADAIEADGVAGNPLFDLWQRVAADHGHLALTPGLVVLPATAEAVSILVNVGRQARRFSTKASKGAR